MRTAAVALVVAAVGSCSSPARPVLPANNAPRSDPPVLFEPPPLYAGLFDEGAAFHFAGDLSVPDDSIGWSMRCRVSEVTRTTSQASARVRCDGDDVPIEQVPDGAWIANAGGLFRGEEKAPLIASDAGGQVTVEWQGKDTACASESLGVDGDRVVCFRAGLGLIGGSFPGGDYSLVSIDRGRDAPRSPDAPNALRVVEVHADGKDNDWFAVANVSNRPVQLAGYVYCDREGELRRAARFDRAVLGPGERYAQRVVRDRDGFQLAAAGETIAITRLSDLADTDRVRFDHEGRITRE